MIKTIINVYISHIPRGTVWTDFSRPPHTHTHSCIRRNPAKNTNGITCTRRHRTRAMTDPTSMRIRRRVHGSSRREQLQIKRVILKYGYQSKTACITCVERRFSTGIQNDNKHTEMWNSTLLSCALLTTYVVYGSGEYFKCLRSLLFVRVYRPMYRFFRLKFSCYWN